jgi:hypothetical protein
LGVERLLLLPAKTQPVIVVHNYSFFLRTGRQAICTAIGVCRSVFWSCGRLPKGARPRGAHCVVCVGAGWVASLCYCGFEWHFSGCVLPCLLVIRLPEGARPRGAHGVVCVGAGWVVCSLIPPACLACLLTVPTPSLCGGLLKAPLYLDFYAFAGGFRLNFDFALPLRGRPIVFLLYATGLASI